MIGLGDALERLLEGRFGERLRKPPEALARHFAAARAGTLRRCLRDLNFDAD